MQLYDPPGGQHIEAHVAFLRSLRDAGILLMAGLYDGGPGKADDARPSGMIVLAVPEDKAQQIAEADPLVRGGARYIIRRWTRTF